MAEESGVLGQAAGFLGGALGDAGKAAVGMAGELFNSNQKLSAYSAALTGNTKLFNKLGGVINGLVQFAEQSLTEYQTLSGIGASFGKEMSQIKMSAAEMGLSVADMTKLLQENSSQLRAFGGTTDAAVNRFRMFSKSVLDSNVGTELRRLGYTAADINETLLLTGEINAQSSDFQRMTDTQRAESAKNLATQMDGLAKLTGKQRDQIAQEMRKQRRDGQVQAFLMGKSSDAQQAFTGALTSISSTMGGQFSEVFKDISVLGTVTKDNAAAFQAMGPQAQEAMNRAAAAYNAGDIETFNREIAAAQGSFADYTKSDEARQMAMLGGLSPMSAAMEQAYETSTDFRNGLDAAREGAESAVTTMARMQEQITSEQARQMEQTGNLLDKTIGLQEELRNLTVAATAALPNLENAAVRAIDMFTAALPNPGEVADSLSRAADNIFNAAEGSLYRNMQPGISGGLGDYGAATGSDVAAAAEAMGAGVSETVTTDGEASRATINETAAVTDARVEETRAAVAESEQRINQLQEQKAQMLASGLQETDGAVAGVSQQLEQAKAELLQAQANAFTASKLQSFQQTGRVTGFAEGGRIGHGQIGMVGEAGPEFVAGPGMVMSAKTSMGVMQNLMKGIGSLRETIKSQPEDGANAISNNANIVREVTGSLSNQYGTMIGLLQQLVEIESGAAQTANRSLRATKGLSGNMLKGLGT